MTLAYCTECGRRGLVSKALIYVTLCPHCMTPTLRVAKPAPVLAELEGAGDGGTG